MYQVKNCFRFLSVAMNFAESLSFAVSLDHPYLMNLPYAGWGLRHLNQGILVWLSWDSESIDKPTC